MSAEPAAEDLCEECPLSGETFFRTQSYASGWPTIRETVSGLAVAWDDGDELHLQRWQVAELHRVLEEHAGRWA